MENVPTQQQGPVRPNDQRRLSQSRGRDAVRTWTRRWRRWVTLALWAWWPKTQHARGARL